MDNSKDQHYATIQNRSPKFFPLHLVSEWPRKIALDETKLYYIEMRQSKVSFLGGLCHKECGILVLGPGIKHLPSAVELGVLISRLPGKSKMTFNCVPHTPGQWLALGSDTGQLTYAHPAGAPAEGTLSLSCRGRIQYWDWQLPSHTHALNRDKRTH